MRGPHMTVTITAPRNMISAPKPGNCGSGSGNFTKRISPYPKTAMPGMRRTAVTYQTFALIRLKSNDLLSRWVTPVNLASL